jgi:quercetin dioxygenase-like cupin family protein
VPATDDVLVGRGDGETITERERREVVLLAEHEDISMTWSRYGPGERGPDPHVHREHTDSFYVLDGELTFALGAEAERVRVTPGTFIAVPPNLIHSFLNEGDADARFLNLHTPDGGFGASMRGRRDGRDVPFDSFAPPADGGLPAGAGVVSAAGEGERLASANRVALLKGDLTHLSFAEWEIDGPLGGPAEHEHDDQVDAFYVLEGELEFSLEGSVHDAGPGTLACVPRGVRYTFAHPGEGRARMLNVHAPGAGFAEFLRGISDRSA